jgi:hypothetical protein
MGIREMSNLAIPWSECKPFYHGVYEGILKNGNYCQIDVDNKIKVFINYKYGEVRQVGSDEVEYWLCPAHYVISITNQLEAAGI